MLRDLRIIIRNAYQMFIYTDKFKGLVISSHLIVSGKTSEKPGKCLLQAQWCCFQNTSFF